MRATVAVALVLLVAACSVGQPAEDATGEEIYQLLCVNCHGEDLSGGLGPALGPGSNSERQPDEFLVLTIMRGRGSMPSFSSSLNSEQLDRLVRFLRQVQRG